MPVQRSKHISKNQVRNICFFFALVHGICKLWGFVLLIIFRFIVAQHTVNDRLSDVTGGRILRRKSRQVCCSVSACWPRYVNLFSWRYNPLWLYFHSPVAGFGLLVFEVSWLHTRRATDGRTPLDEWSIRRRDLYLTTYNTHNRQTSMPPVGFEPTIPAGERPKTYALDRAATGTGICELRKPNKQT